MYKVFNVKPYLYLTTSSLISHLATGKSSYILLILIKYPNVQNGKVGKKNSPCQVCCLPVLGLSQEDIIFWVSFVIVILI